MFFRSCAREGDDIPLLGSRIFWRAAGSARTGEFRPSEPNQSSLIALYSWPSQGSIDAAVRKSADSAGWLCQ